MKKEKGFMLVELIIVLVIISALAFTGVLNISASKERAELEASADGFLYHLREIRTLSVALKQDINVTVADSASASDPNTYITSGYTEDDAAEPFSLEDGIVIDGSDSADEIVFDLAGRITVTNGVYHVKLTGPSDTLYLVFTRSGDLRVSENL